MRKIITLCFLCTVFCFISCNNFYNRPTHQFVIENKSDWRVIVSLTNVKEVGKAKDKSYYTIGKKNDAYSLSHRLVFDVYEGSVCRLESVNGAKITIQTENTLLLDNSEKKTVFVINETGRNLELKNHPFVKNCGVDNYYSGDYSDNWGNKYPQHFYISVFNNKIIPATANNKSNAIPLTFYAWQLFNQNAEDSNRFAHENIKITDNGKDLKTEWEKESNLVYLYLKK